MSYNLGIDTVSDNISLAIEDDGRLIIEKSFTVTDTVSHELISIIDNFLKSNQVELHDITGLAVCIGPGNYGPLRAGLSITQGLALARNLPIAPINRLEADAWPFIQSAQNQQPVISVHDAGRLGLAWGAYNQNNKNEPPRVVVPPSITDLEECAKSAPPNSLWCGELSDESIKNLLHLGYSSKIEPLKYMNTRAKSMLELASVQQSYQDPSGIEALYLQPPRINR